MRSLIFASLLGLPRTPATLSCRVQLLSRRRLFTVPAQDFMFRLPFIWNVSMKVYTETYPSGVASSWSSFQRLRRAVRCMGVRGSASGSSRVPSPTCLPNVTMRLGALVLVGSHRRNLSASKARKPTHQGAGGHQICEMVDGESGKRHHDIFPSDSHADAAQPASPCARVPETLRW